MKKTLIILNTVLAFMVVWAVSGFFSTLPVVGLLLDGLLEEDDEDAPLPSLTTSII